MVEVGSHDGVTMSTSLPFIHRGWSSILVEPHPEIFQRLLYVHGANPSAYCVDGACGDQAAVMTLNIGGADNTVLSSLVTEDNAWTVSVRSGRTVEVQVYLLRDLLLPRQWPTDYSVLLVDTEGFDPKVLAAAGLDRWRLRVIVTEEYPFNLDWLKDKHDLLRANGYAPFKRTGDNMLRIQQERWDESLNRYAARHCHPWKLDAQGGPRTAGQALFWASTTRTSPPATRKAPSQASGCTFSCSTTTLDPMISNRPSALNGYATLSGTRDSVVNQASAEMPKTARPPITHGEVAALTSSCPPSLATESATPVMPCLSSSCPAAAASTANINSRKLGRVNVRSDGRSFGTRGTGAAAPACSRSCIRDLFLAGSSMLRCGGGPQGRRSEGSIRWCGRRDGALATRVASGRKAVAALLSLHRRGRPAVGY